MIGTRLDLYEQSHRHLSAAAHIIESLAIHADAGEHLALEMVLDEARKSLGALERTISTGLASFEDAQSAPIPARSMCVAADKPSAVGRPLRAVLPHFQTLAAGAAIT